jgi:hypothetical protein
MKSEMLGDVSQLGNGYKMLVHVLVALQAKQFLGARGMCPVDLQRLSFEEMIQWELYRGLGFYRGVLQPGDGIIVHKTAGRQGYKIGISQTGIAAKQIGFQSG